MTRIEPRDRLWLAKLFEFAVWPLAAKLQTSSSRAAPGTAFQVCRRASRAGHRPSGPAPRTAWRDVGAVLKLGFGFALTAKLGFGFALTANLRDAVAFPKKRTPWVPAFAGMTEPSRAGWDT